MRSQRVIRGSGAGWSLALLLAALISSPALAQEQSLKSVPEASAAIGSEAFRVFRDPATGELRAPTKEEREALKAAEGAPKARQPLTIKAHGGGMVSAVVGLRALDDLVAHRDADGRLTVRHSAHAAPVGAAPAPQREER